MCAEISDDPQIPGVKKLHKKVFWDTSGHIFLTLVIDLEYFFPNFRQNFDPKMTLRSVVKGPKRGVLEGRQKFLTPRTKVLL